MIINHHETATDAQIDHVVERVEVLGLKAHLSRGTYRTVIGVIGDEQKLAAAPLAAIPGVAKVVPVLPSFKLASNVLSGSAMSASPLSTRACPFPAVMRRWGST